MPLLRPRKDHGRFAFEPESYGRSRLGAPLEIWMPESASVELLVVAGLHGEEPDTSCVLSRALRTLAGRPATAAVILGANPDGLARGTRANAAGVDLNRNFPSSDWRAAPVTCRWTLEEASEVELFTGSAPASEPETRALLEVIERLDPAHIIMLHGPLGCIDDPGFTDLGKAMARRTGLPLVGDIGYPTPGSIGTWARENGRALITYEFPRQSMEELGPVHLPVLVDLLTGTAL